MGWFTWHHRLYLVTVVRESRISLVRIRIIFRERHLANSSVCAMIPHAERRVIYRISLGRHRRIRGPQVPVPRETSRVMSSTV
jgi:hypothetical protein